jgi:hypothetical protein
MMKNQLMKLMDSDELESNEPEQNKQNAPVLPLLLRENKEDKYLRQKYLLLQM